jgi:hypothetical protein
MKTERFEDQIRKKLESIEPEFRESDWANFTDYSSAKMVTSAKIFTGTIFKIAASVAIVGTLFLSLAQFNNNNDLKEQIQNLTDQNEKLLNNQKQIEKYIQNNNILDEEKELANAKTNIENGLTIEGLNNEKLNLKSPENLVAKNYADIKIGNETELASENSAKSVEKSNKINNNSGLNTDNIVNNTIENKSNNESADLNEKKIFTKNSSKKVRKGDSNQPNIVAENNQFTSKNNGANRLKNSNMANKNSIESGLENNNLAVNNSNLVENSKMNLNYLTSKGLIIDSTRNLRKALKKSDFAYYKIPEKKKAYFTLADAYLRAGVNGSISRGTTNYGLVGELFLDQRISISSGYYNMKHKAEAFITTYSYQKAKHYDFKDRYKEKIMPSKEILNIKEKTDLVVVPVHLNYSHPISNSFKLVGTIGTELDINGISKVDYNFSGPMNIGPFPPQPQPIITGGPAFESGSFNSKIDTKLFNNVYLGIGAEKQFGKFAIQAKAYDNFLVKEVDYRKSNRLGLELGVFYRL